MSAELDQLFTVQSLVGLQGAAAAAVIVPNVFFTLIGERYSPRMRLWTAFLIAMACAFGATSLTVDKSLLTWIVAFLNGCLIFASAVGVNQAFIGGRRPPTGGGGDNPPLRGHLEGLSNRSWFQRRNKDSRSWLNG